MPPEDIVITSESGREIIYATTQDGLILRIDPAAKSHSVFARTGGKPLGMERDSAGNFIVADAYKGLSAISPDGSAVTVLTDAVNGTPILYADDLYIAENGALLGTA